MKKLNTIKEFGNIDPNLDDLLESCFEEHEAYRGIVSLEKMMVIGKKGSGKTSIYKKMLSIQEPTKFVRGQNLSSYPWHYHTMQVEQKVPEQNKYLNSWKYLILLELAKIIINDDASIQYLPEGQEHIDVLRKFLIDTYGSSNPDLSNTFTATKKVKIKNLISFKYKGTELGTQLPFEEVEMKDLPTVIYEINKNIMFHVLEALNPEHFYYICFDELDLGFEKNDDYYFMIIGLIKAAKELFYGAHDNSKRLNICIFLRDDIYDLLKFEDKRKVTQNLVVKIEWDTARVNNTLKSLMEKRFTELLKENENEIVKWEDIFDNKRINGNNTKYDYILDFTCHRPRDIIDFCNIILFNYKQRNAMENKFLNEDIINAKEEYSENFLEEFEDEIHKHLVDFDMYLDIIKRIGKVKFPYSDFENQVRMNERKLKGEKDPLTILEQLYEFSVIGNYLIGGSSGGSKKSYKYMNVKNCFDETKPILIHMGLAAALKLREK